MHFQVASILVQFVISLNGDILETATLDMLEYMCVMFINLASADEDGDHVEVGVLVSHVLALHDDGLALWHLLDQG